MVVDHQVADRPLDVVAEPADLRVVLQELPLEEAKGKLLIELLHLFRIADGLQQVAVHGPGVAEHQEPEGVACLFGRTVIGLEEHGPVRGKLTEPRILLDVFHDHVSWTQLN